MGQNDQKRDYVKLRNFLETETAAKKLLHDRSEAPALARRTDLGRAAVRASGAYFSLEIFRISELRNYVIFGSAKNTYFAQN